jgi:hypothetical protein
VPTLLCVIDRGATAPHEPRKPPTVEWLGWTCTQLDEHAITKHDKVLGTLAPRIPSCHPQIEGGNKRTKRRSMAKHIQYDYCNDVASRIPRVAWSEMIRFIQPFPSQGTFGGSRTNLALVLVFTAFQGSFFAAHLGITLLHSGE